MEQQFRLLGPVEVARGQRVTRVPGTRRPLLLALLALDAGQVVTVDELVDGVWDTPPGAARHALEELVSSLRPLLDRAKIASTGGGYVLEVEPHQVDVTEFRERVSRAGQLPDETGAALLRSALSLRRGRPLANCRSSRRGRTLAAALEEEVAAALARVYDLELGLGKCHALLPELSAAVQAEPFREDFRARLMRALYLSGRQTEALAVFREGRRLLDDAHGLEPGPELKALEVAILRHDAQAVRGTQPEPQRPARDPVAAEQLAGMWRTAVRERDPVAFERIDAAAARIEAALLAALAEQDQGAALEIVGGLWFYWILRCQGPARYSMLRELATGEHEPGSRDEALGIIGLSELAREAGEVEDARRLKYEALAYFRAAGVIDSVAALTSDLAALAALDGDDATALELAEEGLRLRRQSGNVAGVAHALVALGAVHWRSRRDADARASFEEAAEIYASAERVGEAAFVRVRHLAPVLRAAGEHGAAYGLFYTGLRHAEMIGDSATMAVARHGLAWVAMERHDLLAAARLFSEASDEGVLTTLTSEERAAFHDDVARLRTMLPPHDFAVAWEVGSTTPVDSSAGARPPGAPVVR
jgi:DNA-binding SARP family transcriptional activator